MVQCVACQTDITTACDPATWPQPDMMKVRRCEELTARFTTGAQRCLDLSIGANKSNIDTACDCWTNSSLVQTAEATRVCKFPTEAKGGRQSR